jgi:hypothetical protein
MCDALDGKMNKDIGIKDADYIIRAIVREFLYDFGRKPSRKVHVINNIHNDVKCPHQAYIVDAYVAQTHRHIVCDIDSWILD